MRIKNGEDSYEANSDNSYFLEYQNDMLNGFFMDIDDDNFMFISPYEVGAEVFADLAAVAATQGITTLEVDPSARMSDIPHCWIVAQVGRIILKTAEELTHKQHEEGDA